MAAIWMLFPNATDDAQSFAHPESVLIVKDFDQKCDRSLVAEQRPLSTVTASSSWTAASCIRELTLSTRNSPSLFLGADIPGSRWGTLGGVRILRVKTYFYLVRRTSVAGTSPAPLVAPVGMPDVVSDQTGLAADEKTLNETFTSHRACALSSDGDPHSSHGVDTHAG